MHNEAQRVIGKGLSLFSRVLLGLVAGLFGVVMVLIAPGMSKPIGIYGFGAFCIAISLLCVFTGKYRNYLGRLVGAVVFAVSMCFLVNEISGSKLISSSKAEPAIINAVLFFLAFGLPGGWFAAKGKFPIKPYE
ncbi:hypothetical protein MO867_22070 [Microbulbifer sp. OS29]|uniref:Uncharacterized protein n=1 Tax=Microbulbifer okhotskensis TaxID=2926617 RepID=A0A9X2ESH7_9GAMM|nr:hypothetical protein [Microbulbifer okhotskensis]MCO1337014.1 hypothetical protein [Microbulbifer okhotskensis]